MNKIFGLLAIAAISILWISCSDEKSRYVDLRTGKTISIEKDPQTGVWMNTDTKEPVYIYVDTKSNDTIYGKTGVVINGHVTRSNDNIYWYDADVVPATTEVQSGDYKKEVEKDGDIKIKDGDTKIKIDGETGERKVKKDD